MKGTLSDKGVVSGEWDNSPCVKCRESWCCTNLSLYKFTLDHKQDMERAQTWLEHRDIILGLQDNGEWTVYLSRKCRFLEGQICTLHGKAEQPWICKRFNPHTCWYKRAFPGTASRLLLQFNHERFRWLMEEIHFLPDGEIDGVLPWEELQHELVKIPMDSRQERAIPSAPLVLPLGKLESDRDRDLLKYKLCFPGVHYHEESHTLRIFTNRA